MLTLTRKVGEAIHIGGNVMVVVRDIKGKQVRIGVDAPLDLPVYRGEIFRKIVEENRQSADVEVSIDDLSSIFTSQERK